MTAPVRKATSPAYAFKVRPFLLSSIENKRSAANSTLRSLKQKHTRPLRTVPWLAAPAWRSAAVTASWWARDYRSLEGRCSSSGPGRDA